MAAREQSADDVERGLRTDQGPGNGSLQQAPQDHAGPAGPHEGCRQGQSPPCANKTAAQRLMQLVSPCSGTSDMYGIAVGSLMDACRRGIWLDRKLCAALAALVFTMLLQMALVGLLWQAAASGNKPAAPPATDGLWLQVGRARQEVCKLRTWVTQNLSEILKMPIDLEHLSDPLAGCPLWRQCTKPSVTQPAGAPVPSPQPAPSDVVESTSPSCKERQLLQEARDCLSKQSKQALPVLDDARCRHMLINVPDRSVEYGWGLFTRSTSNITGLPGEESLDSLLDPGIVTMFAFIALVLVVHDEAARAAQLCFVAASFVGITPPFFLDAPGAKPRLCGCHLQRPEHVPWLAACALLLLPFVQLLVAVAVLSIGGALLFIPPDGIDHVSIIINAVALTFILSLDNFMGSIFRVRRAWDAEEMPVPVCSPARASSRAPPKMCCTGLECAGLAYFALIGLLLLAETTLLAPQSSQHMLSFLAIAINEPAPAHFFNADFKPPWSVTNETRPAGINDLLLASARLHANNWFLDSVWIAYATGGFPGAALRTTWPPCGAGDDGCRNMPMTCQEAMGMLGVYVALTVAVIFLLHRRPLPTRNLWWPWALALLQSVITLMAQLQYGIVLSCPKNSVQAQQTHTPQAAGFVFVLIAFAAAWLVMFLVWPVCADKCGPAAAGVVPEGADAAERQVAPKGGTSCSGASNAAETEPRGLDAA